MTAGGDNTAKVWRVEDKKLTQTFSHGGIVSYARFTPDGRFVLTGSQDKTAVLWVAETGRKMATLKLGDGVRSMAFSLDGRLAHIGSFDKTARLVDFGKYSDLERTASYFRARLAQILNHIISQYIGPPPTPPVIAPRGEEERDSAYRRRITAENGRYKTQVREYREKQLTFPVWRRNQIVEYTFYSVFGTPVVKDLRHDATDGRTIVVIGSNSALAGGIKRNLLLKENVPQQYAAAMKNVLSQGTPFIRLSFQDGRLIFSEAIIEANGRSYQGEFVDDIDSLEVSTALNRQAPRAVKLNSPLNL